MISTTVVDHAGHDRGLDAEQIGVADGPAHDAAQHVAAVLVGREDAVADQERGASGRGRRGSAARRPARASRCRVDAGRLLGRAVEQPDELVGLPDRVDALEHRHDALEPRAGVDRRLGQRHLRAVGRLVELHEDEVPDLDEPLLAAGVRGPPSAPNSGPLS